MKVLHVQKVAGVSGSETHLLDVVPRLRSGGIDARMLVLHQGEPGAREFATRMRAAGVPTPELRLRGDLDPLVFASLVRLIRRERPEIVHTHLIHADLYALPAARLAGVRRAVSTKHGFNAFRESRTVGLVDRAAARLADANVAISQGLADYLERTEGFSSGTFRVVHYGIEAGPEPPPPPAEPRVVAVGRLIPVKGMDVLVDAFRRVREAVPEATLEIAGEGADRAELERRAGDGVTFLGRVQPVEPLLERAAIVAVPSRGEGFGMVALEAHERGRAVVATRVGGLPEIVEDGITGILVPSEDAPSLAEAIVALLRDSGRCRALGEAGRRRTLERFAPERTADALAALYRELLA